MVGFYQENIGLGFVLSPVLTSFLNFFLNEKSPLIGSMILCILALIISYAFINEKYLQVIKVVIALEARA